MKKEEKKLSGQIKEFDGVAYVPFVTLEIMAIQNKKEKIWMYAAFLITIVLIVGIFMYSWCQYDSVEEVKTERYEYSQDGNGVNNLNTGEGDLVYESEIENNQNDKN